jgi:hypothetical protein
MWVCACVCASVCVCVRVCICVSVRVGARVRVRACVCGSLHSHEYGVEKILFNRFRLVSFRAFLATNSVRPFVQNNIKQKTVF